MTLHIFTSAALNYLPKVQQLVESIRRFHPEAQVTLALADLLPEGAPAPEGFDRIISVADLGLDNWKAWAFGHTLVELATAIKPFVLEKLLSTGPCKVLYLDPDTVLFDRLDDILSVLDSSSVALTPHLVTPETSMQGILDNEMAALKHGIYNLGFVAVKSSATGLAFAQWWKNRCKEWCVDDIPNGLFTDQRWIDLVPALFPEVFILRSPRFNVAPWNISHRLIVERAGRLWVNDEPLGFYHFTGFDSGAHSVMALRYAGQSPSVKTMIENYQKFLKEASSNVLCKKAWAFVAFENGEKISIPIRRLYKARKDLQDAFHNPFSEDFRLWWHANGIHETAPSNTHAAKHEITSVLVQPRNWKHIIQRAWQILHSEGWRGFTKRLQKYY